MKIKEFIERMAEICQENQVKEPLLKVDTKDAGSFYGKFSEVNKVNGLGLKVSGGRQFIGLPSIESIEYCPPRKLRKKLLTIKRMTTTTMNPVDWRSKSASLSEISRTLNDIGRILQATYY